MTDGSKQRNRYPLERKPLRSPGESIRAEMDHLFEEEVLSPVLFAICVLFFTGWEWVRWFLHSPPQPMVFTGVAVLIVGYCVYKFVTVHKRYRALQLGLEGEKFVGQYLEDLRRQGCKVFHDIVGQGFNIDHVVVSPRGIFVIETKTYSKPRRGKCVVEFDGQRILINGFEPERNAVSQVRALGRWLRDLLTQRIGRQYPVKCAVVLPGWFVELRTGRKSDVWVLNHKALPSFIEQEPIQLRDEEVALISSRIIDYMQMAEKL